MAKQSAVFDLFSFFQVFLYLNMQLKLSYLWLILKYKNISIMLKVFLFCLNYYI